MLNRLFHLDELSVTVRGEVIAGVTTFMTMAYIIFVNPMILNFSGDPTLAGRALPLRSTITATCLTAGVLSLGMGIFTNYPIALAAGMGLNAVVAYQLVAGMGLPFSSAMGVIALEGLIITILVLTGFRKAIMEAIPLVLKKAIGVGIGLFIAFIGLIHAGFVRKSDTTLVTLGDLTTIPTLIAVIGLLLTITLLARRVKGALLIGIFATTVVAVVVNALSGWTVFTTPGTAVIPQGVLSSPDFGTFGRVDFGVFTKLGVLSALLVIFSIMLSDFFDTMGTVIGVTDQAGLLHEDGSLPRLNRVLLIDSLAALFGGIANSSSVTSYIESASGVAAGGRSGLTAAVVGGMFLLAMFFSPLVAVVPKEATAPALIVVGFFMMMLIRDIPFDDFEVAFPAFVILLTMPVTFSISNGIGMGFITYTVIKLLSGKGREVHYLLYLVAVAFMIDFAMPLLRKVLGF
jgi:AGZA family xanthine/uracil permease-like MFS transporter